MQNILKVSCGLDVHKDSIEACIIKDNVILGLTISRKTFSTLRGDILKLRDWLVEEGCLNVAMESTGVYWKPIYEILEEVEDINLCLVNAHHMRNLPGRKTDVKDAEWIATLFMYGLLTKSFVPERGIRDLREYTRFYTKLNQSRVREVNRLEKFLQTHGFKLSSVISDITGVSGRRILEKLALQGYISSYEVKEALDRGIKRTAEEIAYAVNGSLNTFARSLLRLILDTIYCYEKQLEGILKGMSKVCEPFNFQVNLLADIPGIAILSARYIIAEIGVDMSRFETSAHIASWAGLVPSNDESAGKIKSKKILKGNTYVKSVLCQCAWAAVKKRNTRLSNWYWRNVKRLGQKKAITAVARKLLCYIYHILRKNEPYDHELDKIDTEKNKAFKLESAKKQVAMLECKNINEDEEKSNLKKEDTSTQVIEGVVSENKEEAKSPILKSSINASAPKKRGRPKKISQNS